MDNNYLLGKLVKATAGRDKGELFFIISIINDDYVHISNGGNRKLEHSKLKKLRHLEIINSSTSKIILTLLQNNDVSNKKIKALLNEAVLSKDNI